MENPVPVISANNAALTCSVYMCTSSSQQTSPPEFYSFPKDLERCSVWVKRCSRSEVSEMFRRHGTRRLHCRKKICSQHFQEKDFIDVCDKSKGLKGDAVPSGNLPSCCSSASSISSGDSASYSSDSDIDQLDSPQCADVAIDSFHDASSDSSEDLVSLKGDGTLNQEAAILKKRLLDNERKNSRLKRAIERLKRQNIRYKKKLS